MSLSVMMSQVVRSQRADFISVVTQCLYVDSWLASGPRDCQGVDGCLYDGDKLYISRVYTRVSASMLVHKYTYKLAYSQVYIGDMSIQSFSYTYTSVKCHNRSFKLRYSMT